MNRTILLLIAAALCASCATTTVTEVETPDQAIAALKAGNARYVAGKMQHPNTSSQRLEETLNGQKPFATIIACSDSRVPVELLFDQGIGDLFVIRTAGNSVNSDVVMGSVDYAISHLETPLVVVLGHQHCGGVTSTIAQHEGEEAHHHGKIGELLSVIRQDVEQYVGHPEQLDEAIAANSKAQVDRIEQVEYIQEIIDNGKLKVVQAYYNLDSGEVEFYE